MATAAGGGAAGSSSRSPTASSSKGRSNPRRRRKAYKPHPSRPWDSHTFRLIRKGHSLGSIRDSGEIHCPLPLNWGRQTNPHYAPNWHQSTILLPQPRISVKCEMRKERIMCDQATAAERSDFRHVARGIRERMTDKLSIYVLLFIYWYPQNKLVQ